MTRIQIKTKVPGNQVNLRQSQNLDDDGNIKGSLKDGDIVEGKLSKNGEWYRVGKYYVLSSLCVELDEEEPEDEPEPTEDAPSSPFLVDAVEE